MSNSIRTLYATCRWSALIPSTGLSASLKTAGSKYTKIWVMFGLSFVLNIICFLELNYSNLLKCEAM